MNPRRVGTGLALALLLWSGAAADPSARVVTGATLIDGTGGDAIPHSTVVIANGRIVAGPGR